MTRRASGFRRRDRRGGWPAQSLLTGERTALNFVQRLSGIATLASAYVKAVEGTGCRILDTRKTTPGLRRLEKMAAAAGGAVNHRMGLLSMPVADQNNHIAAAGGVRAALERTRNAGVPVEIEVRTRWRSSTKRWLAARGTCCLII